MRGGHVVGVALFGAKAAWGLGIFSMVPGAAFQTGRYGAGLSIGGLSDVLPKNIRP